MKYANATECVNVLEHNAQQCATMRRRPSRLTSRLTGNFLLGSRRFPATKIVFAAKVVFTRSPEIKKKIESQKKLKVKLFEIEGLLLDCCLKLKACFVLLVCFVRLI